MSKLLNGEKSHFLWDKKAWICMGPRNETLERSRASILCLMKNLTEFVYITIEVRKEGP